MKSKAINREGIYNLILAIKSELIVIIVLQQHLQTINPKFVNGIQGFVKLVTRHKTIIKILTNAQVIIIYVSQLQLLKKQLFMTTNIVLSFPNL